MASNLALRPALTAAAADLHAYILSILSDPGMTKCNPQRPQVSRGHCAKLQGWPGGLPRGRGAHQGGRGGRRGRQIAAGSKIISGYFLTYIGYAPVGLTSIGDAFKHLYLDRMVVRGD